MTDSGKTIITIEATIHAPIEKVWNAWTKPAAITKWNNASPDWHTTRAENDLREGGKFLFRMEAKDGSMGFDFFGIYDSIVINERIHYTMGDGRKVDVEFLNSGNETKIIEMFEAEDVNPVELQRNGWQAILSNFKNYVESNQ